MGSRFRHRNFGLSFRSPTGPRRQDVAPRRQQVPRILFWLGMLVWLGMLGTIAGLVVYLYLTR